MIFCGTFYVIIFKICNDQDLPWGIRVVNKGRAIFEACYTKHKDLWDFEDRC
jgi:hypothetical protein